MNGLDPRPHLRAANMPLETPIQCPSCKNNFQALNGFTFLTFWYRDDGQGGKMYCSGHLTFDTLSCLLVFCGEEECGHC